VLQRKIVQVKEFPKSAQKEVEHYMAEKYNVKFSTTVDIFNGLLPIESMSYDMMYKLMNAIREVSKERYESLDASDLYAPKYFTEQEISSGLYDKPLEKDDEDIDMVFNNWLQVNPDQYVCVVPIEQIIEWRNLNKLKYNPKTQRELTEKSTKGGIVIKVVTVFKDALKAIYNLMAKNEFISDDITVNVNPEYFDEPTIVRGNLFISSKSRADLIDGFHRYLEMCEAKDNNPDWHYNCIINVMVFNEEKAQRYMIQKDKKNHLSPKQVAKIDKTNENNYAIKRLNTSSNFHFKGKLTDDLILMLSNILRDNVNIEARAEAVEISKKIENGFNALIEEKDYFNKEFTKHEWFLYLYLLKISNFDKDKFITLINSHDIDDILSHINFRNEPTKQNYNYVNKILGEVK
jgi:hypothetical protein